MDEEDEEDEDEGRFYPRHCSSSHPSKMRPLGCSCSQLLTTIIIIIIWIFVMLSLIVINHQCTLVHIKLQICVAVTVAAVYLM